MAEKTGLSWIGVGTLPGILHASVGQPGIFASGVSWPLAGVKRMIRPVFLSVSGLTWVYLPGHCRILRKKKCSQSIEICTDTPSHLPSSGGQSSALRFKNGEIDSTP